MDKRLLLIFIIIFFCSLSYVYASDENITISENVDNIEDFHELNVYNKEHYLNFFKNEDIFKENIKQSYLNVNNSESFS